jgi:VWFA-related protein
MRRVFAGVLAAALLTAQEPNVTFRSSTNLVVVSVVVRDRSGAPIEGLKPENFTILENGKPQAISIFEFQQLSDAPAGEATVTPAADSVQQPAAPELTPRRTDAAAPPAASRALKDRRLLVLYFDLAGMPPTDQIQAQQAAEKFLREKLTAADVVSIMSFGSALRVDQEFTADRDALFTAVQRFRPGEGETRSVENIADSTDADTSEEDAEMDLFSTDRRLAALESAVRNLGVYREKKALIYLSSGSTGARGENQAQLLSTVNAAVRANVSFYPVDVRGLVALPPGGSATEAAPRGTGVYSGATQRSQSDRIDRDRDTLNALAADTGGKALFDTNDLVAGITQAQRDVQSYYTIGYYSTDPTRDGRFRRIEVKLNGVMNARVDYRRGYYGEKDWRQFNASDREKQLQEALALGDPITDLPVALEVDHFRLNPGKIFVSVAVNIPGRVIPLERRGTTEFDFIAAVRDAKGRTAASVRDGISIKLPPGGAAEFARRSIQYDTGFTLPPGDYSLRFVVREHQSGKIGTYDAKFRLPEKPVLSSVVWSSQREPVKAAVGSAGVKEKLLRNHPLVRDGQKLAPNLARVFRAGQRLYIYAEAYDPQLAGDAPAVAASVSFFAGRTKVFETDPVRVDALLKDRTAAVPLQIQIPLDKLPPGRYTCQLNVVDQVGRRFTWERTPLVIVPAQPAPTRASG